MDLRVSAMTDAAWISALPEQDASAAKFSQDWSHSSMQCRDQILLEKSAFAAESIPHVTYPVNLMTAGCAHCSTAQHGTTQHSIKMMPWTERMM